MIHNTRIIDFRAFSSECGCLVPIEEMDDVPFDVKRIYYIFDVPEEERRGFHSHRNLEQVLICVHGSVSIYVKTPFEEDVVELNDPEKGLYIGPMVWREMFDWKDDGVLLVLASKHYDEGDYIRNYAAYESEACKWFGGK